LIIAEEEQSVDGVIDRYRADRKISVLSEPLDIHQFKRKVEDLS